MKSFELYLSAKRDKDIIRIANLLGYKNFRKLVVLCLRGLFDEKSVKEAKMLVQFPPEDDTVLPEQTNGGIRIHISLSGNKNAPITKLISCIQPGLKSEFIKTSIRQVLGARITILGFLNEDINTNTILSLDHTSAVVLMNTSENKTKENKVKTQESPDSTHKPQVVNKEPVPEFKKPEVQPQRPQPIIQNNITRMPKPTPPVFKEEILESKPLVQNQQPTNNDEPIDILSMLEMMM